MLPLLAAASERATPLEKLQNVSGQFWLKVILAILAIGLIVFILKKIAVMNKIVLTIVLLVVVGLVGFNWIYNRNEPKALTPIVDILAQWFPTTGAYDGKQQQEAEKPAVKKNTPAGKTNPAPQGAAPAKK